jgi:hypothetical protein
MIGVAALSILVFYIIIYWFEPFSDFWNNFLSNLFLQLASLFAAVVATMTWAYYEKNDAPRRVWGPFALGLWLWFAAELVWGIINMTVGDVPIGLPDVFWIASYPLLGLALLNQYTILLQPERRTIWLLALLFAAGILAMNGLFSWVFLSTLENPKLLDTVVNTFYPAGDLVLAGIALWLAHKFMGGAFARPWMGLWAFSFADLLYAWLEISGAYAWSVAEENLLTTFADVAYLAAYLVLCIGVLSQWLFLKYGLRTFETA